MPRKPATAPVRHVGAAIRTAREAAGLSQEAAARAIAVSSNTWARWEQGRHEPDLPTLRKVADALGTTAAALVDG